MIETLIILKKKKKFYAQSPGKNLVCHTTQKSFTTKKNAFQFKFVLTKATELQILNQV